MPRGLREDDKELPLQPAPWNQKDTDSLHLLLKRVATLEKIADEYERMEWLKKKLTQIFVWGFGLPALLVYIFEPIEKIWKLLAKLKGS